MLFRSSSHLQVCAQVLGHKKRLLIFLFLPMLGHRGGKAKAEESSQTAVSGKAVGGGSKYRDGAKEWPGSKDAKGIF